MADFRQIAEKLEAGEADEVKRLVQAAINQGVPAADILNQGLLAGMESVGAKFKVNEIFVPDVIFAARAMTAGLQILQPKLAAAGIKPLGRVVMGTVKGDLHDIGKNLVCMMLRGAGFSVTDLGSDVPVEKFVAAAREGDGNCVVGLSALLTTTMPKMAEVVTQIRAAGLKNVKVMIGGAPVTQGYAKEIGADGYAPDAATAADVARELMGVGR
jgi:5-methyltetrahydrofolate--homocysteine methyltransferase